MPNFSFPMILAQRILDMLEESGATPQEQKMALDILRPQVVERAYGVQSQPQHQEDVCAE